MGASLHRLLRFLLRAASGVRRAKLLVGAALVSGVLAGAASAGLLASVNELLAAVGEKRLASGWRFAGLCVLLLGSRFTSEVTLAAITGQAISSLRLALAAKILSAPLLRLEAQGSSRLLSVLTEDIAAVSGALTQLPLLLMHSVVVAGCLAYLAWLSLPAFVFVSLTVVVGGLTYQIPMIRALRHLRRSRELWDRVYRGFEALIGGIKELKLHRERRSAFLDQELGEAVESQYDAQLRGAVVYAGAASWGQLLFFIAIGTLLITAGARGTVDVKTLTGFTLVLLYLMTPLEAILRIAPILGRASISARTIEQLGLELERWRREAPAGAVAELESDWQRLELDAVELAYRSEDGERAFHLGPIDLEIGRGEIVFLVGGNGSGKTTLAKLLLGLYEPDSGAIRLDHREIGEAERADYRQLFSVVFFDFYLFDRLLGLESEEIEERAALYLRELELTHKVSVEDGRLSTLDLSQGQRKRLALLTAYLEDRPIYVFDEWAADQDPEFKEVFYRRLVPDLRARGKTVIVISHDSRYFDLADRIVVLELGKVARVERGAGADLWSPAAPAASRCETVGEGERAVDPAGR